MSVLWLNWAFSLPPHVKGATRLLAITLADCASDEGDAWYSVAKLQTKTALSERAVRQAATELVELGLLRREINGKRSYIKDGVEHEIRPGHRPNIWQLVDESICPADSAGDESIHPAESAGSKRWGAESAGGGVQNLQGYRGAESAPNPSLEPSDESSAPSFISRSTQEGQPEPVDNSAPGGEEYHPAPSGRPIKKGGGWMEEWAKVDLYVRNGGRHYLSRKDWPEITRRAATDVTHEINNCHNDTARIAFGNAYKRRAREYAAKAEARTQPSNGQQREIPMIGRRI